MGFLDHHRATLLWKIDGVSDEDLRRPMVGSGTSLLGMVKHLAYVEQGWFQRTFLGREVSIPWTEDDPDADFRIEPGESTHGHADILREMIDGVTGE